MLACRTRRLALVESLLRSQAFSTSSRCNVPRAQRVGKRLAPPRLDTPEAMELFQSVKATVSRTQNSAAYLMTQDEILSFNDNLTKLRMSIRDGNMVEATHVWSEFDKSFGRERDFVSTENSMGFVGLKQTFTTKQLQPLSNAVHALCVASKAGKKNLTLDDQTKRVLGEICMAAAIVASSHDGLIGYMSLLLKRGELDEIIALNSQLLSFENTDNQAPREEHERESELAFYDGPSAASGLSRSVEHHPDRATILLFCFTAYAIRNEFYSSLHTALETNVRLNGTAIKRFVDNQLVQQPGLASRVEDYTYRIATARMIAQPKALNIRLNKLVDEHRVQILEKIYGDIISGITGTNPYIAADSTLNHDNRPVCMTENGWATFLAGFLKCRRPDLAEKLWNDLLAIGFQPSVMLWTSLISGHGSIGNIKQALSVWETMLASEIKPDALTYRALISVLFSVQSDTVAMEKFAQFRKELPKQSPESQVLHVYNTVLHGLLTSNNEEEAKRILTDMKSNGPNPDLVTYNTFMRYYGRRAQFQAMANLVKELEAQGIVGDVFTFSTILSAFLKAGRPNAAEMMTVFMRKHGVEPNVATQSAMIDQQMRQEDETGVRGAMDILSTMERDPNMKPNEVTYTTILAGIHRNSRMSAEEKGRIRKDITNRMDKAKISPSRLTYQILMQACFDNPEPEGLQHAMNYYRTMMEKRIPLTPETWYVVLRGLLQREAWVQADEAVRMMYKSTSGEPKGRLVELVKQIRMRRIRR